MYDHEYMDMYDHVIRHIDMLYTILLHLSLHSHLIILRPVLRADIVPSLLHRRCTLREITASYCRQDPSSLDPRIAFDSHPDSDFFRGKITLGARIFKTSEPCFFLL